MSDAQIQDYKSYYTRLLFARMLLMMVVLLFGCFGPRSGVLGILSVASLILGPICGAFFGQVLRWSYDFDQDLNAIGKGPYQRRRR